MNCFSGSSHSGLCPLGEMTVSASNLLAGGYLWLLVAEVP